MGILFLEVIVGDHRRITDGDYYSCMSERIFPKNH
jgi:hypothetical protein